MHNCLATAKTDFGRAVIDNKLKKVFPQLDQGQRRVQLEVWYMMAITVRSCLLVVGRMLHIPKDVERQMDLCVEYGREAMMLHVHIMDFIWQNFADDPDAARELAGWKDDHINPITHRMTNLREATMSKVAYGTFNLAEQLSTLQCPSRIKESAWVSPLADRP
jgi:hypothetical protein